MPTKLKKISIDEIKKFHESKIIIIIANKVYDVTDYCNTHPGGSEILIKHNRQDATEAFLEVAHSDTAKELLKEYIIGYIKVVDEEEASETQRSKYLQKILHVKKKLITSEDPYFFHKIFGLIVLFHFAARSFVLIPEAGNIILQQEIFTLNSSNIFSDSAKMAFALAHGLLSFSSLIFFVPRIANQNKPMIHQMFRAHSICFATRAILCMITDIIINNVHIKRLIFSIIVFSSLVVADKITEVLTEKDDRYKTTDSMPYWNGCSYQRERLQKWLYGFAQFLATTICLFGSYESIFFTLPAIQGAAFLMTLVRKGLITPYAYHHIYTFLLFYPIPFFMFISPALILSAIALSATLFLLRKAGINKYFLWVPVIFISNVIIFEDLLYTVTAGIFAISAAVLVYIMKFKKLDNKKLDNNNRIISTRKVSSDGYELIIRTKLPMHLKDGQHVLIQINDALSRKYTPIWTKYLKETDQTLMSIKIKRYESKDKMTASAYLTSCKEGSLLSVYGPYGHKYFCSKNNQIIDETHSISYDLSEYQLYLLSAGTGITPIYQLAKNICSNLQKKIKLITCDTSIDSQIMKDELVEIKKKFYDLLDWTCFLSKNTNKESNMPAHIINERISAKTLEKIFSNDAKNLVVMCGPSGWQEAVATDIEHICPDAMILMW